ncbi:MAG: signal peptidase II [Lachnospiraceae bacterium]|nr:signal peptidase II [Lachnospiraceae bacterium]
MKEKITKRIPDLIFMILLIAFDQITKLIARQTLADSSVTLIEGVFEFKLIYNKGVAWGMFNSLPFLISIFAVIIMSVVFIVYIKIPKDNKKLKALSIMLILIFSGAAGNLIDRLIFSAVTDFIYISLINFPIFNIADCYITIAGILTAILLIFYYKEEDMKFLKIRKQRKDDPDV